MDGKYLDDLNDCTLELKKIKKWIDKNKLDSNVKYLVNYAVIKSSGTIETVFKKMVFDKLVSSGNIELNKYLTKMIIKSSMNPTPYNMHNLLKNMSYTWADDFDKKLGSSKKKTELESLVRLRNTFAHGNNITASIDNIIVYFNSGAWVLNKLFETLNS